MRALVLYESMFGNNRLVAEAICLGLADVGVPAEAREAGSTPVLPDDLSLLVVGAPNHAWSLPRSSTREDAAAKGATAASATTGVREWLEHAERLPSSLSTAAYDTRAAGPKSVVALDHASSTIERRLARLGATRIAPAEHFRVADVAGPLLPDELERARAWGASLGTRLVATAATR